MTAPHSKNYLAACAAALFSILLMLNGSSVRAQSAGLRIMPLGDSITAGYDSTTGNGYRGPLWNELVQQGTAFDFVGSQRSGSMFDNYNEGYYGHEINDIAGLVNNELALYHPNVVLLDIGINDLGNNYEVSTAPARLGALIDQIIAADPTVTILVATLIPNTTSWVETDVVAFNAQLPGIVQTRQNQGEHVYLVSMSALTTADLNGGLHPNDGGYQKMADAWDAGIEHVITAGWIAPIQFAGTYELQCLESGDVVDVSGGSTASGATVLQWPYQGHSNQLWNFIPTSSGYYQIQNANSGLDLSVTSASTVRGASIVQEPFGSQGNDQWRPAQNADGSYAFYNLNSGLILDDPNGTVQGTQFDQWGANEGTNQKFNMIPVYAPVSSVSATWGKDTAVLTAGSSLLPAGRTTDVPWSGISSFTVTLSAPEALTAADVSVTGLNGTIYGPVTVTGSGSSYTLTLAKPITAADVVTLSIGSAGITSFSGLLPVLPGDITDDGAVNASDLTFARNMFQNRIPSTIYGDLNGEGTVNISDYMVVRQHLGNKLP